MDHFSVIVPKEKEKKPELKIHPLFIKKKKAVEEEKKENIAPPPVPVKKKNETPLPPPPPLSQPKSSISKPKRVSTRHDPFESIIKADTQNFFLTQKKLRASLTAANKQSQPNNNNNSTQALDIQSIEIRMNEYYPHWKKEPCCQVLFNTMSSHSNNNNNNNKTLWCDKYRPNQVNGLLGYLPDYEYLRDWLNNLKIKPTTSEGKKKKKKKTRKMDEDLYNLILFVGDHGVGKSTTAYTAAKETGYTVFEINSTCKRTGKDIINQVGEMTASHLVKFDNQQQKRKRKKKGEMIIMRDTVKKKPKTIDIAMHFKKMLTVSEEVSVVATVEKEKDKDEIMQEDDVEEEEEEEQKPVPAVHTIESFFKRQSATTLATTTATITTKKTTTITGTATVKETATQKEEEEEENDDEDIVMEDEPKQSLVLIEEVDILFEEDKGFWPAVIELCQKSKRPIIMTCNDKSQIPFDYLNIQSTIYFDIPSKTSLLPYLQLICFAEEYVVEPYDIEFLCELYNYDIRKIIDTLQLWLSSDDNSYYLFARIMGFADLLLLKKNGLMILMDRLKGSSQKTIELCTSYFISKQQYHHYQKEKEVMGIESIYKIMENAAFADAWIGLTDKQRHQIYDIDQYDNVQDMLSTSDILLYKNATDLDHWELGEIIENSISVMNLNSNSSKIWRNHLSAWSSHWEYLYNASKDSLNECSKIVSSSLLLLNYPKQILMTEYMPHIRSMCIYDQGVAGKGRTKRSRRKIRYINLDDESRDLINWQQI